MRAKLTSITWLRVICLAVVVGGIGGCIHGLVIGLGSNQPASEVQIAAEQPTDVESIWDESKRQFAAAVKAKFEDPSWQWQMTWAPVAGCVLGVWLYTYQAWKQQ